MTSQSVLQAFRGHEGPLNYSAVIALAIRLEMAGVSSPTCQELVDWANEVLDE